MFLVLEYSRSQSILLHAVIGARGCHLSVVPGILRLKQMLVDKQKLRPALNLSQYHVVVNGERGDLALEGAEELVLGLNIELIIVVIRSRVLATFQFVVLV